MPDNRIKKESHRRVVLDIPSGKIFQYTFKDTKPNGFFIENLSNVDVLFSVTQNVQIIPLLTIKKVEKRSHIEIKGTTDIFFYVQSNAKIILESFEMENISPSDIPETSVVAFVESPSINVGDIDSIKNPLPSGNNNIGKVSIESIPSIDIKTLPSGGNKIGNVGVESLPALPVGENKIGKVDVSTLPDNKITPTLIQLLATPTVQSISLINVKSFSIKLENQTTPFFISFDNVKFMKLEKFETYQEDKILFTGDIFIKSTTNEYVNIIYWV